MILSFLEMLYQEIRTPKDRLEFLQEMIDSLSLQEEELSQRSGKHYTGLVFVSKRCVE